MNTDDVELWCIAPANAKVFGLVRVLPVWRQAEVSGLNEGLRRPAVHASIC